MRLRNLPSMDLLRSFEATARHLSFTKAANELYITQSAVSRQIKSLEDSLGIALYQRGIRELTMTEAGARLYQTVNKLLKQLESCIATLDTPNAARPLGIATNISVAALWLIPRLKTFRAMHPGINVRVTASNSMQDIRQKHLDVVIRYARPGQLAQDAMVLFCEEVFAVCSPDLLSDPMRPLRRAADLRKHMLLHLDDSCGELPWYRWSTWLDNMGCPDLEPSGIIRFNHYDQLVQAAIGGLGVALGRDPLIRPLLMQGQLICPFREQPTHSGCYHIEIEEHSKTRPDVIHFVKWLFDESNTSPMQAPRPYLLAQNSFG
jgi:LysR family transcriptional regulator, glycine cleavage system transcriptional activator